MPLTEVIGEVQRVYPNEQWLSRARLARIVGVPDKSMRTAVEQSAVRTRREPNCPHKSLSVPVRDFPGLVPPLVEQRSNAWLARQVKGIDLDSDFRFTNPLGSVVVFKHKQDVHIPPVEVNTQWSKNPKIRDWVSGLIRRTIAEKAANPAYQQTLIMAQNKSKIELLSVLDWDKVKELLTDEERKVIETRFGLKDHQQMLTNVQAACLLSIKPRTLQDIESKALRKLAQVAAIS